MEFEKVIKERRSIRRYKDDKIPHELMEEIVELARFAPSWKNTQIARYIVVDSEGAKARLASPECVYNFTYNVKTLQNSAAVVLLTYEKNRSGFEKDGSFSTPLGDRWQNFDCGVAAMAFCLAAHEKGVGTVIMGYYDEEEIRKHVEIPESQGVGAVIACGFADEEPAMPPRKDVDKILTFI